MRTYPDILEIVKGERGMLRGIEACVTQQCLVSAVSLIYSSIDSLAALTRPNPTQDTNKDIFMNWVDKYMRPDLPSQITAKDLYAARCGILHNYSQDSSLRRRGEAKALVYYWKKGPTPDQEIALPTDAITIAIEELVKWLEQGVVRFLRDIDKDSNLKQRVDLNRTELLCYKPYEPIMIRIAA